VRLADWPRMPFLSEELCGWINEHLATLGVEEIAIYAVEDGPDDDGRRVLVATEVGLLDYRYGPRASTARFAIEGRVLPWQAVRGVDLRVETFRLWALEHRTRWSLQVQRPAFKAATEDPQLGRALADFAKVAVIMAEPSGWPPLEDGQVRADAPKAAPATAPAPASAPPPTSRPAPQPPATRPEGSAPVGPGVTRSASRPQS
jgi:hypothetical protein